MEPIENQTHGDTDHGEVIYEMRIYHATEGKLDDLASRFRNHTTHLFKKHGLKEIAYWTAADEPLQGRTLIYILEHPNRSAAQENWRNFISDPEWIAAKTASEANGKLVESIDSTFMSRFQI